MHKRRAISSGSQLNVNSQDLRGSPYWTYIRLHGAPDFQARRQSKLQRNFKRELLPTDNIYVTIWIDLRTNHRVQRYCYATHFQQMDHSACMRTNRSWDSPLAHAIVQDRVVSTKLCSWFATMIFRS
jgi:hypothetical protein